MSALPVDSAPENPRDPLRILAALRDEEERRTFLRQYRDAVEAARDPAGWNELDRTLRLWAGHVLAMQQPGYQEARARAETGEGEWLSLDEAIDAIRASQ